MGSRLAAAVLLALALAGCRSAPAPKPASAPAPAAATDGQPAERKPCRVNADCPHTDYCRTEISIDGVCVRR